MPSKPGKPVNASDSEIALKITQGLNNSDVARALHVDRKRVARVRALGVSLTVAPKPEISVDALKTIVRLEINKEETLNEFSEQLAEYTKNYKLAMEQENEKGENEPDLKAAGYWASLRLRLLENMIHISGLDKKCEVPDRSPQETLSTMSDEEVEARAKAILAKRQP